MRVWPRWLVALPLKTRSKFVKKSRTKLLIFVKKPLLQPLRNPSKQTAQSSSMLFPIRLMAQQNKLLPYFCWMIQGAHPKSRTQSLTKSWRIFFHMRNSMNFLSGPSLTLTISTGKSAHSQPWENSVQAGKYSSQKNQAWRLSRKWEVSLTFLHSQTGRIRKSWTAGRLSIDLE